MNSALRLLTALLLGVGLSGCEIEGADACSTDDDCGVGERCEAGECLDEPGVRPPLCGESNDCAVDILFVIDNSGSMMEEQALLAEAIPPFISELTSRDKRFHIGVISTDMNDCDLPYGSGSTRGSAPQRGCLQSAGSHPSLQVITWETPAPAARLADIIRDVGVYGSAYEKGLEAARHFLTPGHGVPSASACEQPRDCGDDLENFLRASAINAAGEEVEAGLLVIFLTDEEDCSHGGRIDETVSGNSDLCYSAPELLTPTAEYVEFLQELKGASSLVRAGLIAGIYDTEQGKIPSGCKGEPTLTDQCDPSQGNSVATCTVCVDETPVCPCHPAMTCPDGTSFPATNCCQADAARRYFNTVTSMNAYGLASICEHSYGAFLAGWVSDV